MLELCSRNACLLNDAETAVVKILCTIMSCPLDSSTSSYCQMDFMEIDENRTKTNAEMKTNVEKVVDSIE